MSFQASDLVENGGNYTIYKENVSFNKNMITITKGSYTNVTATFYVPPLSPIGWYVGNITANSENGSNTTIFVHLYVFGPPITISLDINPDKLNLKSEGKWITAYIELPEGYNVSDIDISSILLNGTIPVDLDVPTAIGDYDGDGIPDLMVKFNRTQVAEYILSKGIVLGNVTLTITGQLKDLTPFEGSDTIKVRMPGDINMDGKVDIIDISAVSRAFGSYPGHPRWNPIVDENEDGIIDIFDIALICRNFGKTYK